MTAGSSCLTKAKHRRTDKSPFDGVLKMFIIWIPYKSGADCDTYLFTYEEPLFRKLLL